MSAPALVNGAGWQPAATTLAADDRPAAPKYPVVTANVLTHLHESLPDEHAAVRAKEQSLSDDLDELRQYRATLEAVARAAGIALP